MGGHGGDAGQLSVLAVDSGSMTNPYFTRGFYSLLMVASLVTIIVSWVVA